MNRLGSTRTINANNLNVVRQAATDVRAIIHACLEKLPCMMPRIANACWSMSCAPSWSILDTTPRFRQLSSMRWSSFWAQICTSYCPTNLPALTVAGQSRE